MHCDTLESNKVTNAAKCTYASRKIQARCWYRNVRKAIQTFFEWGNLRVQASWAFTANCVFLLRSWILACCMWTLQRSIWSTSHKMASLSASWALTRSCTTCKQYVTSFHGTKKKKKKRNKFTNNLKKISPNLLGVIVAWSSAENCVRGLLRAVGTFQIHVSNPHVETFFAIRKSNLKPQHKVVNLLNLSESI